jgi:hypothetical protein
MKVILTTIWWLQKFDLERFNLKQLHNVDVKDIKLKSKKDGHLWKSWMIIWASRGLERIYKLQPHRV